MPYKPKNRITLSPEAEDYLKSLDYIEQDPFADIKEPYEWNYENPPECIQCRQQANARYTVMGYNFCSKECQQAWARDVIDKPTPEPEETTPRGPTEDERIAQAQKEVTPEVLSKETELSSELELPSEKDICVLCGEHTAEPDDMFCKKCASEWEDMNVTDLEETAADIIERRLNESTENLQ